MRAEICDSLLALDEEISLYTLKKSDHSHFVYRPDIDGLRAIAVTSVVAYHAGIPFFDGGFVGVDIFFVISGYLIGALVYRGLLDGTFSTAAFYERRTKRILPALFGVLTFAYIAAFLVLAPSEMKPFSKSALATITSTSNLYFWRSAGYFAPNKDLNPLLMTWSLGVEEQFYLLFPGLMLLLFKFSRLVMLTAISTLALISFAISIWSTTHHPNLAFYLLPTRAWELAIGTLLAVTETKSNAWTQRLSYALRTSLALLGILLITFAVVRLDRNTPFPGYAALMPVVGALAILVAREGPVNKFLSLRPVVFLGLVSYSWYLWHWPLLSFARIVAGGPIPALTSTCISLLALGCAVISYWFIELPFRNSRTPRTLRFVRYGILGCACAIPPMLFIFEGGFSNRNQAMTRLDRVGDDLSGDSCLVQEPTIHLPLVAPCIPPGNGRAVLLIGDSHAAALASTLRSLSESGGYRFIEFTKGWCPPLSGISRSLQDAPRFADDCNQFNRERLDYAATSPEVKVVIVAAWWPSPLRLDDPGERYVAIGEQPSNVSPEKSQALLEQGLREMVRQLTAAGKMVYLVQDPVEFPFDPIRILESRVSMPRRLVSRLLSSGSSRYPDDSAFRPQSDASEQARNTILTLSSDNPQVRIIDPQDTLCKDTTCKFAEKGVSLYIDESHLSGRGAKVALSSLRLPL